MTNHRLQLIKRNRLSIIRIAGSTYFVIHELQGECRLANSAGANHDDFEQGHFSRLVVG